MIIEFAKYKNYKPPTIKPVKNDWIFDKWGDIGKITQIIDDDTIMVDYRRYGKLNISISDLIHIGTLDDVETMFNAKKYNL